MVQNDMSDFFHHARPSKHDACAQFFTLMASPILRVQQYGTGRRVSYGCTRVRTHTGIVEFAACVFE